MTPRKKRVDNSDQSLNKLINLNGAGEDKVIQELVGGSLAGMGNLDAAKLAIALQQIVRGENEVDEHRAAFMV